MRNAVSPAAGDGRATGGGAGRVHSDVGVRGEGAPGAGARRTRTRHEIVLASGSWDAELKGCVKLTLHLLFSQGALHAANAELTAIVAEKDILVKHLDKCQVCST